VQRAKSRFPKVKPELQSELQVIHIVRVLGGGAEPLRPGQTIEELNHGCEEEGQEGHQEKGDQEEGRQEEEVVLLTSVN
jgi:hypothetical protein